MNAKGPHASITQAALLAMLAVGVKLRHLIFVEIKMILSWLQDYHFSKQSQDGFFAFASAFSVVVNTVPFFQVNSHTYLAKLGKKIFKKPFDQNRVNKVISCHNIAQCSSVHVAGSNFCSKSQSQIYQVQASFTCILWKFASRKI